jgi:hypothetical protein
LAKIFKGEPRNMEPDKFDDMRWFNIYNLPENVSQTTIEAIEKYISIIQRG